MAFTKRNYVSGETVITADNLNAIQDELIRVGGLLGKDIQSATIDNSGHLILTLTDGTTLDAGVAKGADGVTPHIGDNGNWYIGSTDTGKPSRGATGATGQQGPAGAGMDITGATVGQIAKIAAVDASGVPTAWSPVDMPSGGSSEEMRVIKTITITSDGVNSIYFNRDDNGLPFALTKHIRIRMYGAAQTTGSTQATLFFRAGQTTGDASQSKYPIKVNSVNSNYFYDFVFDLYSAVNCWYGDFAHARAGAANLYRFVPSESNNSSDITVREIKLV